MDQQKPDEVVAMAYPVEEVAETVAFLKKITASLDAKPSIREELLDLLAGLGKGRGDARAVESRVAELLIDHHDVHVSFVAFLTRARAPAVAPGPLAVTRTRRSSTRKNETDGQRCRSLSAVEEEPDAQDISSPRKTEAGGHGGRKRDDPRVAEAEAFLKRVLQIAGRKVWSKLVAVLNLHAEDQFANAIYGEAKDVLVPEHATLLGEFASTFLPGKKEWDEQLRREARCEAQRNRRRAAAAARRATAADNQRPPRADDDYYDGNHRQHGLRIGAESSGGGGGTAARGEFDRQHATLEVVKKRRADGGDHRGQDDDNYAPRFRNKKPRADNGAGHHQHAVSNNGEPSSSGVAARVLDAGVKKPRRRAPNGCKGSSAAAAAAAAPATEPSDQEWEREAMFRQFRGMWVFYTRYSTLVETTARVAELLDGGGGGGGGFPSSVEELFPHREHRDLLDSFYGDHWGKMRAALEGGDSTGPALEAVLRMLEQREEEAVAEEARELRRNDAERAAKRIAGLVVDRVCHEERRQRQDAGDGGASSGQHVCPRR